MRLDFTSEQSLKQIDTILSAIREYPDAPVMPISVEVGLSYEACRGFLQYMVEQGILNRPANTSSRYSPTANANQVVDAMWAKYHASEPETAPQVPYTFSSKKTHGHIAKLVGYLKQAGAASIDDIACDLGMKGENAGRIVRHLQKLKIVTTTDTVRGRHKFWFIAEGGEEIAAKLLREQEIVASTRSEREYEADQRTVKAVQVGMWRDWTVAALFGEARAA